MLHTPSPSVSRTTVLASLNLEHFAASFIADASHFFSSIEPSWKWPNLKSIVLTSQLLAPDSDPVEIRAMLQAAAAVAVTKTPRLETLEIWNGTSGLAALFQYQVLHDKMEATITWRATWTLTLEPSTIQTWEAVTLHQYPDYRFGLIQEWLDEAKVRSHGDAMHYLRLSGQVIRPVSLQQIRMETELLQGNVV